MAVFRSAAVTTTSTTIKTTGTNVNKIDIVNGHSAVIYVKFYNIDVATFQDTPTTVYAVPATASIQMIAPFENSTLFSTSEGLSVRVTTVFADNGTTAAATLPIIRVEYT